MFYLCYLHGWPGEPNIMQILFRQFFSDDLFSLALSFQPALLYIVPAVIGCLAAHCIWNGDVKQVSFHTLILPDCRFSYQFYFRSFVASCIFSVIA